MDVRVTDGHTTLTARVQPSLYRTDIALVTAHQLDGIPVVVVGSDVEIRWPEDAPFIDRFRGQPFTTLEDVPGTMGWRSFDPVARATRMTVRHPSTPHFDATLSLVARYRLATDMGHQPIACVGVACRASFPVEVEARHPLRVVAALPAGTDGGACYGNGTCNARLTCEDDRCVPDAGVP